MKCELGNKADLDSNDARPALVAAVGDARRLLQVSSDHSVPERIEERRPQRRLAALDQVEQPLHACADRAQDISDMRVR